MTEDTLNSNTIITDILDNDIGIASEKLSILSDKSSSGDEPNKDSKNLSNSTTDIFKPIITSAIETTRCKSKKAPRHWRNLKPYFKVRGYTCRSWLYCFSIEWFRKSKGNFNKPTTQGLD